MLGKLGSLCTEELNDYKSKVVKNNTYLTEFFNKGRASKTGPITESIEPLSKALGKLYFDWFV